MTLNLDKLAWLFIFVGLIVFDLLNGFLIGSGALGRGGIASPSQLGRAVLVVMLIIAALQSSRLFLGFLILVLALLMRETGAAFEHHQIAGYFYTLITLLKFSLPFLAIFLVFDPQISGLILRYLRWGLLLIALTLIVSLVMGIGSPTYTSGGFGTKAFFASGNGIGIYLGAASLLLVVVSRYSSLPLPEWQLFILLAGLLAIASKTALLFLLVIVCYRALYARAYRWMLMLLGILIIPFAETLWDLFSVVLEIVIRRYEANQDDLLRFITSGRDDYVSDALGSWYQQLTLMRLLFGGGIFVSFQDPLIAHSVDYLETDLFDVFFIYGVVGLAAYFALWTLILGKSSRFIGMLLPVSMLLLHSMAAGHVFFNGLFVQLVIAISAAIQYLNSNQQELIK